MLPCSDTLWTRSAEIARGEVGKTEKTGRNDGPHVRAYLASVGLGEGHSYCQAAIYWSFAVAARDLSIKASCIPILRSGGTQAVWHDAVRRGKKTEKFPQKYDLITWVYPNGIFGHVERVEEVLPGGWVRTVGFNTSSGAGGSQSNGGGNYFRRRNWAHPLTVMHCRGFIGHFPQDCK